MKICKSCIHYSVVRTPDPFGPVEYKCTRSESICEIDLVTGMSTKKKGPVLDCRKERYEGECGKEGKYFHSL